MDRLSMTALGAMQGLKARQAVTAHNLSNAGTTGFRADIAISDALYLARDTASPPSARAMNSTATQASDLSGGSMIATGNPTDVAIDGTAMFAMQGRDGAEGYSRRGDFRVGTGGFIENGEGLFVLGEAGPIAADPNASLRIAPDGGIWTSGADGVDQQIGKLKLAHTDGVPLHKSADGLFHPVDGGTLGISSTARLRTGMLETSNVQSTDALVDMIEIQRAYETQVRMISTAKEIDEGGTRLMRIDE